MLPGSVSCQSWRYKYLPGWLDTFNPDQAQTLLYQISPGWGGWSVRPKYNIEQWDVRMGLTWQVSGSQPPACLSFIPASEPECDINTISHNLPAQLTRRQGSRQFMSSLDRRVSLRDNEGLSGVLLFNKDSRVRSPATIVITGWDWSQDKKIFCPQTSQQL